jgi:hypothetical protein
LASVLQSVLVLVMVFSWICHNIVSLVLSRCNLCLALKLKCQSEDLLVLGWRSSCLAPGHTAVFITVQFFKTLVMTHHSHSEPLIDCHLHSMQGLELGCCHWHGCSFLSVTKLGAGFWAV